MSIIDFIEIYGIPIQFPYQRNYKGSFFTWSVAWTSSCCQEINLPLDWKITPFEGNFSALNSLIARQQGGHSLQHTFREGIIYLVGSQPPWDWKNRERLGIRYTLGISFAGISQFEGFGCVCHKPSTASTRATKHLESATKRYLPRWKEQLLGLKVSPCQRIGAVAFFGISVVKYLTFVFGGGGVLKWLYMKHRQVQRIWIWHQEEICFIQECHLGHK